MCDKIVTGAGAFTWLRLWRPPLRGRRFPTLQQFYGYTKPKKCGTIMAASKSRQRGTASWPIASIINWKWKRSCASWGIPNPRCCCMPAARPAPAPRWNGWPSISGFPFYIITPTSTRPPNITAARPSWSALWSRRAIATRSSSCPMNPTSSTPPSRA